MILTELLAAILLAVGALAHPPSTPSHVELALVTPAPTLVKHVVQERDVIDSLTSLGSKASSYIQSAYSAVSSGFFESNPPTGSQVLSAANISSSDLAAVPTSVLNIPSYANYTNNQWNLRFRGNVYKLPNISNSTIDKLANVFLIDTSVAQLPPSEQDQARNLTRSIYVVQQPDVNVTMNVLPGPQFGGDGEPQGGGGVTAGNINQFIQLPYETSPEGDFDVFVPLNSNASLSPGTGNIPAQRVNVYAQGTNTGNATSYLVSNQGVTIISDIDDILRVTKIWDPKEGLLNSFARPFTPWLNMPSIYSNLSITQPNLHFHYLTTTPEQATRNYMDFIYKTYPGGSFDTRPLNFSDVPATLSIRKYLLEKVFRTFPQRKFILVADTSNSDVMRDYPAMAKEFPGQVSCIWLRNTSATDSSMKLPYNTAGFKDLNTQTYMFFLTPDDLVGLDVVNGQCVNSTIKQNVTFSYQGLPLGLGSSSSSSSSQNAAAGRSQSLAAFTFTLMVIVSSMFVAL